MPIKQTWAARLVMLTLGAVLACGPIVAVAEEETWGLDGETVESEAILGEALYDETLLGEEVLFNESASQAETYSTLQVYSRTQEEIRSLYNVADISFVYPIAYDQDPDTIAPYGAGQLSEETIQQATGLLNFYRYVAGLNASVIPNADYGAKCQAGALLMAVNDKLDHYNQVQPEGMSNELYSLGSAGCSGSNIAMGYPTLQSAIMGWMDDGDSNNIARVGHRRWILNPTMGETGFGAAASSNAYRPRMYSSLYALDRSNAAAKQTMVAWPAQNTPLELVKSNTPWSISFNSSVSEETAHVQVTSRSTGEVWNFSSTAADGEFYVNNGGYGLTGCVIFRPDGIDISEGQTYDVTVTGVRTPVQYRVSFFYVTDELTSITVNSNKLQDDGYGILKPSVTVKSGETVLVEGEDYTLRTIYNSATDITVTATGINKYHGSVSATFTLDTSDSGHVTIDKNDPQLPGRWVLSQGKWWYQYIDGTYPCSKWVSINREWYFFDSEGWMLTGWQQIDGSWYYMNSSGAMQTGWQNVGGAWYYMNGSGVMQTGWLALGNSWYYLNPNGVMATGWKLVDNVWYYLNSSGAMQTGWKYIGGAWYYLKANGAMATGWQNVGGAWYYLASGGKMLTGWQSVGDTWYYMNSSGVMQTNRWIGNYYVTASGAMAKDVWIGNYHVDDSGLWDDTAE